jgi:hypothetical protein
MWILQSAISSLPAASSRSNGVAGSANLF